MKFIFRSIVIAVLLMSAVSAHLTADEAAAVEVYTNTDASLLGRAPDRRNVTVIPLSRFSSSESLQTEGVSTAVMVDASVKKAVEQLLADQEFAIVEGSVISRTPEPGVYRFTWERWGFDIAFSFEELNDRLMDEIEAVYSNDAYLHGELRRTYDDNYSLKIYMAEDVISPADSRIEFMEAMISATVIGSRFQPLLGIRDGLGVLDSLGLAAFSRRTEAESEFSGFREFEENGERLLSFINSVRTMDGDFIDNLYSSISAIMLKHSEDESIILPEQLFTAREGDNTDYALFYYDVLKRMGYPVKLIVIDSGIQREGLYTTVFFREKEAALWGIVDGNMLEREKAAKWQRLPALVFSASVNYFEPDIDVIFEERKIELPPPSKWASSLY